MSRSHDRGNDSRPPFAHALEETLDDARAFRSDEMLGLHNDVSAHFARTEDRPGDSHRDEKHGRNREERVESKRRAEARGVVLPRREKRRFEQPEERTHAHHSIPRSILHSCPDRLRLDEGQ